MDNRHFILDGHHNAKPCSLMEWAQWFETSKDKRIVQQTNIDGYFVSTVFLGIDHRFGFDGPPLLFETMVFGKTKDGGDIYCRRYSTWDEAVTGHADAIKWVKEGAHTDADA